MADITYDKISVEGMKYSKLINLEVERSLNKHACATVICEVSRGEMEEMQAAMNDGSFVTIISIDADNSEVLFVGVKYSLQVEENTDYRVAKMKLLSTSYLLDKEKKKKTWQNQQKTYRQVMDEIVGSRAVIRFNVTDKPLNSFMQNEETDWKMIVRFASACNACVITNATTRVPIIDIGVPGEVESENDIGAVCSSNTAAQYVTGTKSTIHKGIYKTTRITGRSEAFKQEQITCESAAGRMFNGVVEKVEKQKVQVFFDQIDEEYDALGNTWFEYSATYAGSGEMYGSGIYFMPEEGDRVRVFFPKGDSEEGFAFASESGYALDDPTQISWKAPGGQELLFYPDGIKIIGKSNSVYIDLSYDDVDEMGIQIACDTDIKLSTHPKEKTESVPPCPQKDDLPPSYIYIDGKEGVFICADNQIVMETPEARMEMDRDKIILSANQVHMG